MTADTIAPPAAPAPEPARRLRIAQVIVTPVLMWDDGEELTPGPQLNPISVPPSGLAEVAASLPGEVAQIEAQALASAESHRAE